MLHGFDKLSSERDDLNSALKVSEHRIKEFQAEIDNYREEVQRLTESVAMTFSLTMERDSLNEQLTELTQRNSSLEAAIGQMEALSCEVAQLKSDNARLETALHEAELEALERVSRLQVHEDQVRSECEYQLERYAHMEARRYAETIAYLEEELDERAAERKQAVEELEEEIERMQKEMNDATTLALSAQRQLDESHVENHKLKELNRKVMERLKTTRDQSCKSEAEEMILKEANELKELVESLTKKVAELEETNAGYVTSLERNESCLKVEQAPGVCEIQMVEIHEYQQRNDELTEVKFC